MLKTLHHGQGPKKKRTNSHLPLQVQHGLNPCPPQKQDGLQVPQCSHFGCISKSHSHLITLVIRNRDTAPEGLTALDQQPLTRGVHNRVGNRPGKKPEHAAFTSAGSLSAAGDISRTHLDSAGLFPEAGGVPDPKTRYCPVSTEPPLPSWPFTLLPTPDTRTSDRPQTLQQSKRPPGIHTKSH